MPNIKLFLAVLFISLLMLGCNSKPPNHSPIAEGNIFVSPKQVVVGQQATLMVRANDPDGDVLAYYWQATQGYIPSNVRTNQAFYTAPNSVGVDTVTVKITDGKALVVLQVQISIVASP